MFISQIYRYGTGLKIGEENKDIKIKAATKLKQNIDPHTYLILPSLDKLLEEVNFYRILKSELI